LNNRPGLDVPLFLRGLGLEDHQTVPKPHILVRLERLEVSPKLAPGGIVTQDLRQKLFRVLYRYKVQSVMCLF
jgi:hypothetical protein